MTGSAQRLPLCADESRRRGEDPIGTAPHWQEVTVLELDIPIWAQLREQERWTPAQVATMERLGEKVKAAGVGFGLLGSAPLEPGQPLRMRHYTLGEGGYMRRDYQRDLPQTNWESAVVDTLLEPQNLSNWEALPVPSGPDAHVCTNGAVDASCGKYGILVYSALNTAGLRAWRTAHFGGHRFAATAVELPSGLLWAHLTPELAVKVARREVEPANVRQHLRGFAGLPKLAQVLDRELLTQRGWDWLTAHRWAEVEGERVTLHYRWHDQNGSVQARVLEKDPLQVPMSSHKPECSEVKQYRVIF